MKPELPVIYALGNLRFGGRVIMRVGNEVTVELPCGLFIRTTVQP